MPTPLDIIIEQLERDCASFSLVSMNREDAIVLIRTLRQRVNPDEFSRLRNDVGLLAGRVEDFGKKLFAQPDIQAPDVPIKMTLYEMVVECLPYIDALWCQGKNTNYENYGALDRLRTCMHAHIGDVVKSTCRIQAEKRVGQ